MMKNHGLFVVALTCCLGGVAFASQEDGLVPLTVDQLESIEGGDFYMGVSRDDQVMTVTRITPGNYDSIECYSVGVTTSVVRDGDVSSSNPKGAMENQGRDLNYGGTTMFAKQFPSGKATLNSSPGSQTNVQGQVIRTNASQMVSTTNGQGKRTGEVLDSGYNIHYVDPQKATNTWGCIGVQSEAGMSRILSSLKTDNASYSSPAQAKQTVSVSAYSNATPPPASTFKPAGAKTATKATKAAPKLSSRNLR